MRNKEANQMSDINDTRREFEAWCKTFCSGMLTDKDDGAKLGMLAAWSAWQAATERATSVERERCAAQAEKATKNNRIMIASIDGVPTPACFIATAIRKGGEV